MVVDSPLVDKEGEVALVEAVEVDDVVVVVGESPVRLGSLTVVKVGIACAADPPFPLPPLPLPPLV